MIQTPATHRRPSADSDDVYPPGSRRFLGADFILVILFLGIVFYFLIPGHMKSRKQWSRWMWWKRLLFCYSMQKSSGRRLCRSREFGRSVDSLSTAFKRRGGAGDVHGFRKGAAVPLCGILLLDNWGKHSYPNEELPVGGVRH